MKMPASSASAARKGDSATPAPSSSSPASQRAPRAQRPKPNSSHFLMPVPTPGQDHGFQKQNRRSRESGPAVSFTFARRTLLGAPARLDRRPHQLRALFGAALGMGDEIGDQGLLDGDLVHLAETLRIAVGK